MRSSVINPHGPGFDPASLVIVLPPGRADRQDISIFWHDSTRFWQPRSNLNFNMPNHSVRHTNCIARFHNPVSLVPTAPRLTIQHASLYALRCVLGRVGGATPCSRLEFNLRFAENYHTSGLSRKQSYIDMDMSYAREVRTASLTSYPVRCKILHQRTASLIVTNDATRPLVCARITCYVTVITHGRCYARA
jgi:hypothetical protein